MYDFAAVALVVVGGVEIGNYAEPILSRAS